MPAPGRSPPAVCTSRLPGLSFRSAEFLDAEGERLARQEKPSTEELSDRNASVYLEYGVRDRLTLVTSLPYKRLVHKKTEVRHFPRLDTTITRIYPDENESGFADLEMRLRWRLLQDPAVVSVTLGGKLPLGYEMREESNVPLGTAEIDGDTRLLVGKSLYPLPGVRDERDRLPQAGRHLQRRAPLQFRGRFHLREPAVERGGRGGCGRSGIAEPPAQREC